ncbi:MAG TPA: hypothetical protein VK933_04140 [Longimicrobiales bacterium]|nr:hypothetical protein [Longimicrobiales bacterium]
MSDQGETGSAARLIRKVVFTYRLEGDPEEMERTLTLEHGGSGDAVDAFVLSEELIRKLAYVDAEGGCTPVKTAPGSDWKVSTMEKEETVRADCIWVHDLTCEWSEYCPDQ